MSDDDTQHESAGRPQRVDRPAALELRDATVVRGGRRILDSVTLRLEVGRHTAIIGPNGSGKSTLVKLISGQIYPTVSAAAGAPVRVFGRDRWNLEQLRTRIGVVSAEQNHRFVSGSSMGRVTGLEAVVASFFGSDVVFLHHEVTADRRERAREALHLMGALSLAGRKLHQMSSGEVRRVLIARAIVHRPDVLVLDEPTTGLDPVARAEFLDRMRTLATADRTLVLVTHHVDEILPEVERVLVMSGGKLVADGTPRAVLRSDRLSGAFGAPVVVRRRGDRYELDAGTRIRNGDFSLIGGDD